MEAKANVEAAIPQYRSKAEEAWATFGPMILADEYGERVQVMHHEPVTFNLPQLGKGVKYTPDFYILLQSGRIIYLEVKGSKKMRGYRTTRTKLLIAASMFPEFTWLEAVGGGESWEIEEI